MNASKFSIYLFILSALVSACEDYTESYPVPEPSIVAKFTYVSATEFDSPDTVQFFNETYVPEGITQEITYLWDFGDSATSTEVNPTHVYQNEGTYEVTLTPLAEVENRRISSSEKLTFIRKLKGDTLFFEDFDDLDVFPGDWALFNVDQGTVASSRADLQGLNDSAWIVWQSNYFESKVALSTSWYNEEDLDANDWMILPLVKLGQNSTLSWEAMSMTTSGSYPDSYQIRISTTSQDVEGCLANPILYRVFDESWGVDADTPGDGIKNRSVSLAKYANQEVYIAFRIVTPYPGGDRLAIDNISIVEE